MPQKRNTPPLCGVDGCEGSVKARGWCGKHWQRWSKHGDPLALGYPTRPVEERFWEKVEKTEGCWLWTAATNNAGYGTFWVAGRHVLAHRFGYELTVGPIPEGLTLDHLCRTPSCVNPTHLEPVTMRENILRGTSPSAKQAAMTHCKKGHPLTEDNIYRWGPNRRRCRTCHRAASQRQRDARKLAA